MSRRKSKRPLNIRQQRFVDEYLITGSGREAALRAGYSPHSAKDIAVYLRKLPHVAQAIHLRRAAAGRRTQVARDRVLMELARVAFSDIGEVLDWTNGDDITLRPKVEISPHDRAAIAEIAPRRYGKGPRIKLHSKSRALDALVRILGVNDKTMPAVDPAQMMKQRLANREKIMRRINQIVEERIAERCKAGTLIVVEPGPNAGAPPAFEDSAVMPGRSAGHPRLQDVDGRDTPGHDTESNSAPQPSTFSSSPPERGRGQGEGV